MEIVETARQQNEAAKATATVPETSVHKAAQAIDEAIDYAVDDLAAGSGDAPTGEKNLELTGDNQSKGEQSSGVLDHALQDTGPEMQLTEPNESDPQDLPVTDAGEGVDAGVDHSTDNGFGLASPTSPSKRHKRLMIVGMATVSRRAVKRLRPSFAQR